MTLSCEDKIIIAIINRFRRPSGCTRRQSRSDRRQITLAFFTTKSTAHTPRFDGNRMAGNAENLGNFVLNFSWVLGRTMQVHIAIFAGDRERRLSL